MKALLPLQINFKSSPSPCAGHKHHQKVCKLEIINHNSKTMWYIMLFPIIVYFFTTKTSCDTQNSSDVIVTYSNHAEANYEPPVFTQKTSTTPDTSKTTTSEEYLEEVTEDVLFVPNERRIDEVVRNFDEQYSKPNVMSIKDLVNKEIGKEKVNFNTEPPNQDIIFVSGKNIENVEKPSKKERQEGSRRSGKEMEKITKTLNCTKLDCNNTLESVCGGKIEHKKWRYRLFLNECYFNKVNCNFKYEINRYHQVSIDKCKDIAAHHKTPPSYYNPSLYVEKPVVTREETANDTRKSLSSRRSQSMTINGQFCSHSCPVTCPDDYQPECGISSAGQKKVFANHCKLDYHSCYHGTVWHMRPLSDCVGGKKADMRQNRGFIGWMQRVGIVDNKGRLVLSK